MLGGKRDSSVSTQYLFWLIVFVRHVIDVRCDILICPSCDMLKAVWFDFGICFLFWELLMFNKWNCTLLERGIGWAVRLLRCALFSMFWRLYIQLPGDITLSVMNVIGLEGKFIYFSNNHRAKISPRLGAFAFNIVKIAIWSGILNKKTI